MTKLLAMKINIENCPDSHYGVSDAHVFTVCPWCGKIMQPVPIAKQVFIFR